MKQPYNSFQTINIAVASKGFEGMEKLEVSADLLDEFEQEFNVCPINNMYDSKPAVTDQETAAWAERFLSTQF